jgi:hypothetical protein
MLGGHEGDRGRPWVRAVCPGLPACVAARSPTSFRAMVAVRLSQPERPHHCHGTGDIDDGRHICGLFVRAWYQALGQNAAMNVVAGPVLADSDPPGGPEWERWEVWVKMGAWE